MKKIFKNYFSLFFLIPIYFITRLINLTSLPVFADEAIYIRWAQIIKAVETLRFIPVTDGKQPLFMWLIVPFFKFINDPLIAGRLVSIFAGATTLFFLYQICLQFINKKTANLTALLYVVTPFFFFFDRLALADSLLSMFGVIILYLTLFISTHLSLDLSLLLGVALGLCWLTKSPALYFIVLSFGTSLYFNFKKIKKNPSKIFLLFLSPFIAFIIYNILRLGPQFHMIAIRNLDYVHPLSEILKHPLDPLKPHISDTISLFKYFIGPIFLVLLLLPKKSKYNPIFFLWFLLPFIATSAMAKVFTSRYILFTLPPLLILIASSWAKLKNKYFYLSLLLLIPSVFRLYQISFHPYNLKLTSTETGYVTDWTSGWGIKEASQFFIEQSKTYNVIVATEGYFGTLPDGLQIYTNNVKQLTVMGAGLDLKTIPEKFIDAKNHGDKVYFLFNKNRIQLSESFPATLIHEYQKPDGKNLLLLEI